MRMRNGRNLRLLAIMAGSLTLVLTACGSDDAGTADGGADGALTQVHFQLNWVPGGFNAGFALARERGYYEDEGIFVSIIPGNGSATTAQLAAAGNATIAYADAIPVSQLIAEGAPLTVVSTLYQSPPAQVTALADSGITQIGDLSGRSVATATGAAETPMLPLLFEANGIDVDSVELVGTPREAMVPQLLEENVDAILGSMDFYSIQLADREVETVDFPFHEYGVATVSTSIFASNAFIEENPDAVRAFVAGSLRGWADTLEDPDASIEALTTLFPDVDPEEALKQLEATITLFCANNAEFIGKATEEAWTTHQEILEQVGSLPEGIDPTTYYTYDYLPDDGELTSC